MSIVNSPPASGNGGHPKIEETEKGRSDTIQVDLCAFITSSN